jgi:deoxycytidylate deaminase
MKQESAHKDEAAALQVRQKRGPELVFGIVAAVGSDQDLVCRALEEALGSVDYSCKQIRLSAFLRELKEWSTNLHETPEDARINAYMDAGNDFRRKISSGDALAVAAMGDIQEERASRNPASHNPASCNQDDFTSIPIARQAYILRSLKHPSEVDTLRRVYGNGFILVAGYSPRDTRVENLSRRIAQSAHSSRSGEFRERAEHLLKRDEFESGTQFGQNVRDTFPKADLFVDLRNPVQVSNDVLRFVELYFGYPFHTPNRDEFAMFHAQAAALRSAALARQVGAVVTTDEADIIAVGTNEVPKAGGGQYWHGDAPDSRDFRLGYETSDKLKRLLLADILDKLRQAELLDASKIEEGIDKLVEVLIGTKETPGALRDSQLMDLIEFARPMHAEMAAMLDAARRGVSIKDGVLYTTTFPCHDCARHVVAAGIKRLVYIHPYPKSHAAELYPDSLSIDVAVGSTSQVRCEPFIGIAPRRYIDLFTMVPRKRDDGAIVTWERTSAVPKFVLDDPAYIQRENEELTSLWSKADASKIEFV